jgi:hypothetical protein
MFVNILIDQMSTNQNRILLFHWYLGFSPNYCNNLENKNNKISISIRRITPTKLKAETNTIHILGLKYMSMWHKALELYICKLHLNWTTGGQVNGWTDRQILGPTHSTHEYCKPFMTE